MDRQLIEFTDEHGHRSSWGCTDMAHAERMVVRFKADGCTDITVRPHTREDIRSLVASMGIKL